VDVQFIHRQQTEKVMNTYSYEAEEAYYGRLLEDHLEEGDSGDCEFDPMYLPRGLWRECDDV
jgi:hypothetical protein